jgi:hypothetical protein
VNEIKRCRGGKTQGQEWVVEICLIPPRITSTEADMVVNTSVGDGR